MAAEEWEAAPMLALVADVPVSQAKPHGHDAGDSDSLDGCAPLGVTKSPGGVIYAVEKCNGEIYHRRMN
jgi:hypothetical protein